VTFTCNICGATCERGTEPLQREHEDCPHCRSSVRIRALIALLSKEVFGTLLTLPEFPVLKGIRAIGMSDSPELAERLAGKFDYTNTFYDQAPRLDVTTLNPRDEGRYDFILSSEVLEHVLPPVEQAFANLHRMLKPDGMLLMTIETFENLTFHHAPTETTGGHGSALEVRVFTETSLRAILCNAAFSSVHFAADSVPEFGVDHAETWSLPIAARKGTFHPPAAELALQYREAQRLAARKIRDLEAITGEYERHVEHHNQAHEEWLREAALRTEWVKRVEAAWEERTAWALEIQKARDEAIAEFRRVSKSEGEAWQAVDTLSKNLEQANANLAALSGSKWTRLGRKLGLL
jgi:SAM-dependent methyltransferase